MRNNLKNQVFFFTFEVLSDLILYVQNVSLIYKYEF